MWGVRWCKIVKVVQQILFEPDDYINWLKLKAQYKHKTLGDTISMVFHQWGKMMEQKIKENLEHKEHMEQKSRHKLVNPQVIG